MCEPRLWPSSGMFVLLASQERSATLTGHCASAALMCHSLPHVIRCKVEFLATASYFKAAFQVSVLGFLSILVALGCAIPVKFHILGRSLIVPSAWFSGLPEGWSQSVPLCHAFGLCLPFPTSGTCSVNGRVVLSSVPFYSHLFNIFPQRHSDVNRTSTLAPFIQIHHDSTVRNA